MNKILPTLHSSLPELPRPTTPSVLLLISTVAQTMRTSTRFASLSVRTGRLLSHSFLSSITMSSFASLGVPPPLIPARSGTSTPITRTLIPRSVRSSLPSPKTCSSPRFRRRLPLVPRSRSSTSITP